MSTVGDAATTMSRIKKDDGETSRINPYLWVLDGLVSAIAKTACRGSELSNVMLKKYMTRWLKANLKKLYKKYRRFGADKNEKTKTISRGIQRWEDQPASRMAATELHFAKAQPAPTFIPHHLYAANGPDADRQPDYYLVKGSWCLQREELADLQLLRLHRLQTTRSSCISQAEVGTAVQVGLNAENKIRPVLTRFHRGFTNDFCVMQTDSLNGLPEDEQRSQETVIPVERPRRNRAYKTRPPTNVAEVVAVEDWEQHWQHQQQHQQQQKRPWWWWTCREDSLIRVGLPIPCLLVASGLIWNICN
ncbi:unnamed protein product, partial [Dibothriocephalus latus]